MQHYFFKLILPRSTFATDMSDEERALADAHVGYWEPHLGRAVLVFGPVFAPEGIFGVGIAQFADEEQARAFAMNDPVIKANAGFTYEVRLMQAATAANAASA